MQQLLLMLGILKRKNISWPKPWKTTYSFSGSKWRKTMALSCSKSLSGLLNGITTNHCLNSFHKFTTKSKLESHQKLYENKDFSNVIMSSEDTKIL